MRRSYLFVRHGRAVYQEKGFRRSDHPESTDFPLSERGRAQAEEVAPALLRLGILRVASSELLRARQTAGAIAAAGALPYEHAWGGLDEIHPGTLRVGAPKEAAERWSFWDGYGGARAVRRYARAGVSTRGWELRPAEDRILGILRRLDGLDEPRIAVVGHGYWILLASLFVRGRVRYRWIENCSVTRVDADGEGHYRLVRFAARLS